MPMLMVLHDAAVCNAAPAVLLRGTAFDRARCPMGTVLCGHCSAIILALIIGEPQCHVLSPFRHGSARCVARGSQATWWGVTGLKALLKGA
jgi:hypothetical protein